MKTTTIWGHLEQELLSVTLLRISSARVDYCILIWCGVRYVQVCEIRRLASITCEIDWKALDCTSQCLLIRSHVCCLLHVMQSIWQICDLVSASIPDLYDTVTSYFTLLWLRKRCFDSRFCQTKYLLSLHSVLWRFLLCHIDVFN